MSLTDLVLSSLSNLLPLSIFFNLLQPHWLIGDPWTCYLLAISSTWSALSVLTWLNPSDLWGLYPNTLPLRGLPGLPNQNSSSQNALLHFCLHCSHHRTVCIYLGIYWLSQSLNVESKRSETLPILFTVVWIRMKKGTEKILDKLFWQKEEKPSLVSFLLLCFAVVTLFPNHSLRQ